MYLVKVLGLWLLVYIVVRVINTIRFRKKKEIYAIKKGQDGETRIMSLLTKINGLKVLNNLYIPTAYGYSEIDLIALSNDLIFVIESKNYSCKVQGTSEEVQWLLEYANGKKYQMYNPILQNDKHMLVLSKLFNGNIPMKLKSVVVFSNSADLSGVKNNRDDIILCNERDLKNFLLKEISNSMSNQSGVEKMYKLLQHFCNASEDIKKEHIKNVKNYKKKVK